MPKYSLEFILSVQNTAPETIRNSIIEFGDNLEIVCCQDGITGDEDFKVNISTEDPKIIFDTCAQFGRLKSIKIEEVK